MAKKYLKELIGTYGHSHQKSIEELLIERECPNLTQEQLSKLLIEKRKKAQDTLNNIQF